MKTLIIIRHAKSDWDSPSGDFDRKLASRGINDAKAVAAEALPFVPKTALLWSSSARRAANTAVIFANVFGRQPDEIEFKEELYTFDGRDFAKIIKSCSEVHQNLVVFGHNEAITDFVNKFGDILIDNVPTSGFVMITFENAQWAEIGKGKTRKVIFPRELRS